MSGGLRLYWLHNIPSPYRNHRFERMAEIFPSLGIDLVGEPQ